MRVVLDTNIYLSGLIFQGSNPSIILNYARQNRIEAFCSNFILEEIKKNLIVKFRYSEAVANQFINEILKFVQVVAPTVRINIIKDKDEDNRILECAESAKAEYLVTGDKKHILPLKIYKDIKIITAKEFSDIFKELKQ